MPFLRHLHYNKTIKKNEEEKEMKKLNKNRALCLLSDLFILIILISMVLTGNNWDAVEVKIFCCSSLFMNMLFVQYFLIMGGR